MEYRRLGNSGPSVSLVGLGCNNLGGRIDYDTARSLINRALDLGITLFDTADTYGDRGGSEEWLGRLLGDRRKEVVLATKFGLPMDDSGKMQGAKRGYIMSAVEASLKRLNTDWIDLYQIHEFDPTTPLEETLRALDDLIHQGKVRFIGSSNFSVSNLVAAMDTANRFALNTFVCCQEEYSLLVREPDAGLLPAMEARGLGLLPFFPLAGGLLTGKYKHGGPMPAGSRFSRFEQYPQRFFNQRNWQIVKQLEEFSAKRGRSMLELSFSWLIQRSNVVSVIAGASTAEQIQQNVAATNWRLTNEDMKEIDTITKQV